MSKEWPPAKPEKFGYKDAEQFVVDQIKERGILERVQKAHQEAQQRVADANKLSLFKENPFVKESLRLGELTEVVEHLGKKAKAGEDWHIPTARYARIGEEKPEKGFFTATKEAVIGDRSDSKKKMARADYERLLSDIEQNAAFFEDLSAGQDNAFLDDYPELLKKLPYTRSKEERLKEYREQYPKISAEEQEARVFDLNPKRDRPQNEAAERREDTRPDAVSVAPETGFGQEVNAEEAALSFEAAKQHLNEISDKFLYEPNAYASEQEAEQAMAEAFQRYHDAVIREYPEQAGEIRSLIGEAFWGLRQRRKAIQETPIAKLDLRKLEKEAAEGRKLMERMNRKKTPLWKAALLYLATLAGQGSVIAGEVYIADRTLTAMAEDAQNPSPYKRTTSGGSSSLSEVSAPEDSGTSAGAETRASRNGRDTGSVIAASYGGNTFRLTPEEERRRQEEEEPTGRGFPIADAPSEP